MQLINPVEIIKKKKIGGELSSEEINLFIYGYLNNQIPDYQTSALLMALSFNGLTDSEIFNFTKAYINSGLIVDLSEIKKPKVDKHSTGGVGDKTSIILAPLIACFDVVVPMISGRGLGHTGGTLDKLESIPGFKVSLGISEFIRILKQLNVCMIGQTDELVPADKKIYALRDVTATVEIIGLISASIVSKKIAEGADSIVYDIKVGNGSNITTYENSKELAHKLIENTQVFGKKAIVVLTDMSEPLGTNIGNWLEIKECITIMNPAMRVDNSPNDLIEVSLYLAGCMLLLAGKCKKVEDGIELAKNKLYEGTAFEKFIRMVEMQGGDKDFIIHPDNYPPAKFNDVILSHEDGYIATLNALAFGNAAVILGCGRKKIYDKIDYASGIILHKKVGDKTKKNELIAELFSESREKIDFVKDMIYKAIEYTSTPPQKKSKILEIID